MVGMAIAAGVAAASSLAGGIAKSIQAKRQARRMQGLIDRQSSENEAWYKRRYNEDFTQRSEIQSALREARDTFKRQNNAAYGMNAVIGGTDASVAAQKEASNAAYAQAVAGAASGASAEKDKVESRYMETKERIDNKQMAADQARTDANAAAIDASVKGVNDAASAYIAGSDMGGTTGGAAKTANGGADTQAAINAYQQKSNQDIGKAYRDGMKRSLAQQLFG